MIAPPGSAVCLAVPVRCAVNRAPKLHDRSRPWCRRRRRRSGRRGRRGRRIAGHRQGASPDRSPQQLPGGAGTRRPALLKRAREREDRERERRRDHRHDRGGADSRAIICDAADSDPDCHQDHGNTGGGQCEHPPNLRVAARAEPVEDRDRPARIGQPVHRPPGSIAEPPAQHARHSKRDQQIERQRAEAHP